MYNLFYSVILVVLLMAGSSRAYFSFQKELPNGNNVIHPCKVNYRWPGVGHENPYGGGARNPFGEAFKNSGYKWTKELCSQDSDGDGRTNGQELGDPSCIWAPGERPFRLDSITHPGVCEPINSTQCLGRNSFLDCHLKSFDDCNRTRQPDVKNLTMRFPRTLLPSDDTSYFCMNFDLPADQDYHIIANEPVLDNMNVMHHILMFGCVDGSKANYTKPGSCGMTAQAIGCYDILGTWTVGSPGNCLPDNVGYRFGMTSFKRVLIQVHWNNPQFVPDYYDSSGLRIYYQPVNPAVNDLVMMPVGQNILEIPPGQSSVTQSGVCPGSCMSMIISKPVYVVQGLNHMHYLGRSGRVEQYRNGTKVTDLTNDEMYSYDNPTIHDHSPPLEIRPGDELKTTCVFNSLSSNRYVYFGEATQDEMCLGFLTVYSASAFKKIKDCVQVGPVSSCDRNVGKSVAGCDWMKFATFTDMTSLSYLQRLENSCTLDGVCRAQCREVHAEIAQHPCMSGDIASYVNLILSRTDNGLKFLGRFHSCSGKIEDRVECSGKTCPC
ncbi:tyramine beta-hydroxylase-like [Physella acuta]|uniref:tyramine beta-hydroxylase-like n=1 Tax=Physella acuta TaxID=109671 RepID=UPI0027DBB568|nr:tyramine beta-hydroxylase-like [Physella acuta]